MYSKNRLPMKPYDVAIIGSGLGGLASGVMLSREGMRVCILEQQAVVGGCFQSFCRRGYRLDTGIHYVGSLDEGQTMYQYFKYLGIVDRLNLQRLDEEAFDVMCFTDGMRYAHAMGYERFVNRLSEAFPHERAGLQDYCRKLQQVGGLIKPDVLRSGVLSSGGMEYMGLSAQQEIADSIRDERLRNVLAGNNLLYSGLAKKSSFYEHAMINHSNIEGAHCFVGGTQQVADALVEEIRRHGGDVYTRAAVTSIHLEGDRVTYLEINGGEERIEAKEVIAAIHPLRMLELLENNTIIKRAFFSRVRALENSFGLFTTYLMMKPGRWPYQARNYYLHNTSDVWNRQADYRGCNISTVLLCMQPDEARRSTEVITLLTPMPYEMLARWEESRTGHRGEEYEAFKAHYAACITAFAEAFFPGLREAVAAVEVASPLTYRDYTATPQGSAYGIVKDYHNPIVSHLSARTKIGNLFLTGQNLNVHGCLGVAVSAAVTCSELLGVEYLAKKIGHA